MWRRGKGARGDCTGDQGPDHKLALHARSESRHAVAGLGETQPQIVVRAQCEEGAGLETVGFPGRAGKNAFI